MSEFLYIAPPAILGSSALLFLALVYSRFNLKPLPHKISFLFAFPQGLLAWLAAVLTVENPIASPACLLGIFGFYISVLVAVADMLSLTIFMVLGAKKDGTPSIRQQLAFWVVRLITHGGFTLGFLWSAMLCTV